MLKTEIFPVARSERWGLVVYYLLAVAISWLIWSPLILYPELAFLVILGAYGPFLAAMLTTGLLYGRAGVRGWLKAVFNWRIPARWYLTGGLLLPLLMAGLHAGALLLSGQGLQLATDPPWYWFLAAFPVNALLFPYSSGMEEPGWQGFAYPRLAGRFHPVLAGFLFGPLWAFWHLPLYFTAAWKGSEPLGWMVVYTIPLAMILFWLARRSKSVLPAILLHHGSNLYHSLLVTTFLLPASFEASFTPIKTGIYWLIALALIVLTKGRLGFEPKESEEGI